MKHHEFNPDEFLDFVHDVNLSKLKKALHYLRKIRSLPGTKIIYTNGEKNYAKRF